ncbi:hypothetical protein PsAD2_03947 [Pseudovibrio axinellae]|uniref:DUF218 domain-containing protein n=2 Tax=Pseudovibrio axinellae TaxID=989403 RepID=A0A165UP61_9HYPH|nr:hypothetical protein PsAD2_03947 [Pseudovibrio axinellae]SEP63308.1 DUF218 domain-containing protein [Pseudovibrio axinellae]
MQARVQVALKLWRDGLVARILVTGGQVTGTGQLEAEVMCEGLVAAGVPEEKIVLETRATNTGENVRFSIELLKQLDLYDDIHSVIAVGSASASRRYLMTLERYWPDLVKMLMASNRYPVSADKWHEHPEFAADVLREWNKIQPYLDAGYLKELSPQTCPLID